MYIPNFALVTLVETDYPNFGGYVITPFGYCHYYMEWNEKGHTREIL